MRNILFFSGCKKRNNLSVHVNNRPGREGVYREIVNLSVCGAECHKIFFGRGTINITSNGRNSNSL